jgi:hypothetical protein
MKSAANRGRFNKASKLKTGCVLKAVSTSAGLNFEGLGQGEYGFTPNAALPDTNASVGSTRVVEWVNESFAVFDKATGALVYEPAAGNTPWTGFGGGCATNNDGEPVVHFDRIAQRWIFAQFSLRITPYLQCVAVSTTADATSAYNRYSFQMPNFNDYPKLAVWPDAYYMTFNMFSGNSFVGGRACALNSAAMPGTAAVAVCFQLSSNLADCCRRIRMVRRCRRPLRTNFSLTLGQTH